MNAEQLRLDASNQRAAHWKRWGPYVSERAWGTVREDYSADGTAWEYFPHDHARSRAYRWNEDGLAGICDRHQIICFALALWNGQDPILKERAFGLTGIEGNHGEDVKEYYFYLDSTPTHSYMKYLYKYPQRAFPYDGARRREPAARPQRARVRAARHRRLRRRSLLRRLRRVREGLSGRHAVPDLRRQPRRSARADRPPADGLVPEYVVLGTRQRTHAAAPAPRRAASRAPSRSSCRTASSDARTLAAEGSPQLLFVENETNRTRLFGAMRERPLRQRRHQRLRRATAGSMR